MALRTHPWWAPDAQKFIDDHLTKNMKVLEWGGGGSTPWLAERCKKLITIEHHPKWAQLISDNKEENCEVRLRDRPYHKEAKTFKKDSFDLIIVDGRDRVLCFLKSIELVKPGGYIVLDDCKRDKYKLAWDSVKDWEQTIFINKDPKEARTGSRNTAVWKKPLKINQTPV